MGCFGCTPVCPGCNGCGSGPYDQPPHRRLKQDAPEIMRLEAEIARLRAQEAACCDLHHAYLRLRGMIPGAFKTPYAPTPEQVWEITENALRAALKDTTP